MTFLYAYLALYLLWVLYLAAMNLQPHLKTMHPIAKVHGYALYLTAALFDVVVNWTLFAAWFMEWPASWKELVTARLKRYHGAAYEGVRGNRGMIASLNNSTKGLQQHDNRR